jgi:hypothetical protein
MPAATDTASGRDCPPVPALWWVGPRERGLANQIPGRQPTLWLADPPEGRGTARGR